MKMHLIDKKHKKVYVLPSDDCVSRGKFYLIIPEGISQNSKPSFAGRNEAATAHIKEDSIKDEVILEDYGSSNDGSEDETENEKAAEENNVVKEEIFEDESDNFELENEPKIHVPPNSKSTDTVTQTVQKSAHFGGRCLKSTLKEDSPYAFTRLTKSIGALNKHNQRDGGGNIITLDCTTTVFKSKLSSGKPRTPNYIKAVRPDSYANVCSAPTTVNCTDIPTTSTDTAQSAVSNTNSSSHLPKDNTSSHSSDCDDIEVVFISLKKVPLERRNKIKNKLLRLVKLLTELELDPDEVSFSVTIK